MEEKQGRCVRIRLRNFKMKTLVTDVRLQRS